MQREEMVQSGQPNGLPTRERHRLAAALTLWEDPLSIWTLPVWCHADCEWCWVNIDQLTPFDHASYSCTVTLWRFTDKKKTQYGSKCNHSVIVDPNLLHTLALGIHAFIPFHIRYTKLKKKKKSIVEQLALSGHFESGFYYLITLLFIPSWA